MQNFIFILSPFIFATACLAASEGVEYFKKLSLDCARITGVEKIEAGNKIDGAKAATDMIIVKAEALPPSKVKIAVALPPKDKWNGVFLGNGNGGMGQNLSMKMPIIGANAGYASAHCDLGTDNWWKDPDNLDVVLADFGHDAVYMMTSAGKKIAEAYYGNPPKRSYYLGGSTGGQEGLSMAARHPSEYDAVALLYPVSDRTALHTRFVYERALLHPGKRFSDDQIARISKEIVAQNKNNPWEPKDSKPYLKYPEKAKVDYEKLDFLTKDQIDVLTKIHSPFLDPQTGAFVTFGLPPSCEIADNGKSLKWGFGDWMVQWFFKKNKIDPSDIDLHRYAVEFKKRFSPTADVAPNLGKFRARGGKLLILQGKIDTIVPASYICDWYSALCENTGSFEKTRDFARVFLLPGGWHGNISGVDLLGIARNWAEKGIAPESIKATVNVNGQKHTEEAELFVPEEDEEE